MVGMDSYMNAYLDRRMKYLIQDWDLATRNDLGDFETRMQAIEDATKEIDTFEAEAEAKHSGRENNLPAGECRRFFPSEEEARWSPP